MKKLIFVIATLFVISACEEENTTNEMASLKVHLTDAPAAYQEVLIDIEEVRYNMSEEEGEENWHTLENMNAGVYNLLDFTNGIDTLLVEDAIPAGTLHQIRLILGDDNQIKVDGEYHDIQTPSAQQSGLKLNVQAPIVAGITYEIWLDFDAGRSIVEKGNGGYLLKPVIRAYTEELSGAISGVIEPVEAEPYIMAIMNDDTIATYADTESGEYLLSGLEAGRYDVEFEPVDGYNPQIVNDVDVVNGEVTTMDTITFQMN